METASKFSSQEANADAKAGSGMDTEATTDSNEVEGGGGEGEGEGGGECAAIWRGGGGGGEEEGKGEGKEDARMKKVGARAEREWVEKVEKEGEEREGAEEGRGGGQRVERIAVDDTVSALVRNGTTEKRHAQVPFNGRSDCGTAVAASTGVTEEMEAVLETGKTMAAAVISTAEFARKMTTAAKGDVMVSEEEDVMVSEAGVALADKGVAVAAVVERGGEREGVERLVEYRNTPTLVPNEAIKKPRADAPSDGGSVFRNAIAAEAAERFATAATRVSSREVAVTIADEAAASNQRPATGARAEAAEDVVEVQKAQLAVVKAEETTAELARRHMIVVDETKASMRAYHRLKLEKQEAVAKKKAAVVAAIDARSREDEGNSQIVWMRTRMAWRRCHEEIPLAAVRMSRRGMWHSCLEELVLAAARMSGRLARRSCLEELVLAAARMSERLAWRACLEELVAAAKARQGLRCGGRSEVVSAQGPARQGCMAGRGVGEKKEKEDESREEDEKEQEEAEEDGEDEEEEEVEEEQEAEGNGGAAGRDSRVVSEEGSAIGAPDVCESTRKVHVKVEVDVGCDGGRGDGHGVGDEDGGSAAARARARDDRKALRDAAATRAAVVAGLDVAAGSVAARGSSANRYSRAKARAKARRDARVEARAREEAYAEARAREDDRVRARENARVRARPGCGGGGGGDRDGSGGRNCQSRYRAEQPVVFGQRFARRFHEEEASEIGVEPNVSEDDLKRAYRKAAMKWHPDKNMSNVKPAEDKFKEIQQAYDTLRDPRSRQGYDHMLMNPRNRSSGGGGGRGRGGGGLMMRRRRRRGEEEEEEEGGGGGGGAKEEEDTVYYGDNDDDGAHSSLLEETAAGLFRLAKGKP
eukprot:jgi/Undpi1/10537/HiC_scaffold_29.g12987.m1